jgi:hypothetical protein
MSYRVKKYWKGMLLLEACGKDGLIKGLLWTRY